jgi:hypothetical protein
MTLLLHERHHPFRTTRDSNRKRLSRKRLTEICLGALTVLLFSSALAGVIALKTAIYVSRLPLGAG